VFALRLLGWHTGAIAVVDLCNQMRWIGFRQQSLPSGVTVQCFIHAVGILRCLDRRELDDQECSEQAHQERQAWKRNAGANGYGGDSW